MNRKTLRDLASRLALHCVRNTVIEDYDAKGQLSQADMKAFNKEVVDKIYTMLTMMFDPSYKDFVSSPTFERLFYRDSSWDPPKLDADLLAVIELWRQDEAGKRAGTPPAT